MARLIQCERCGKIVKIDDENRALSREAVNITVYMPSTQTGDYEINEHDFCLPCYKDIEDFACSTCTAEIPLAIDPEKIAKSVVSKINEPVYDKDGYLNKI